MNRTTFIFILFLISIKSLSQNSEDTLKINFDFFFNHEKLELGKKFISKSKDTLEITSLKFYVSNINLEFDDETKISNDGIYLMDFEKTPNSIALKLNNKAKGKTINKVIFSIGIDSLTNVSGALEGDLDPTKGMYWAWQSGYINFKMEGKSKNCLTPKNKFQFHIGGYLPPFESIRKVSLYPRKKEVFVKVDVSKLFSEIKLSETNSVMIPGKKAVFMANLVTKMFYLN
jgi:hypothetical protein